MYYRIFTILVFAFWLTMTGLLIRSELHPSDHRLHQVPVAHVIKQLFLHQQPSDLHLRAEGTHLGNLRIAPTVDPGSHERRIDTSGNLRLSSGTASKSHFSWIAQIAFDQDLEFVQAQLTLVIHEPSEFHVELSVNARDKIVHTKTTNAQNVIISQQDYTLDKDGATTLLNQMGVDAQMLNSVGTTQSLQGKLTAELSTLTIQEERVETYVVNYTQNEQTLFEIHVSQIGQILQVKTLLGYTLAPEDLHP